MCRRISSSSTTRIRAIPNHSKPALHAVSATPLRYVNAGRGVPLGRVSEGGAQHWRGGGLPVRRGRRAWYRDIRGSRWTGLGGAGEGRGIAESFAARAEITAIDRQFRAGDEAGVLAA